MSTQNSWNNKVLDADVTLNGGIIAIGSDNTDNAINISTSAFSGRATKIGTTKGSSSLVLIGGSTGITVDATGVVELNSTAAPISIGNDADSQDVNIATAGARTVTVGNNTTTTSLVMIGGTTGATLDATGVVEINSSAAAISIGNDTVSQAINVGTAGGRTVTIGNASDAASVVDVIGGTTNGVRINNDINSPASINGGTSSGSVTIGNTAGAVSQTINVATGNVTSGTRQINIGTGTNSAGTQDVAIGNADGNTTLTVNGIDYQWPTGGVAASSALVVSSTGTPNVLAWSTNANGDVVGPASSTDNAIARFDSTTGRMIKNSGVLIDNSDNVTGVVAFTSAGTASVNATGSASTTIGSTASGGTVDIETATVITMDSSQVADGGIVLTASGNNGGIDITGTAGGTGAVDIGSGSGGINLNASINNPTNINTGTSSAAVTIGNTGAAVSQTINIATGNVTSGTRQINIGTGTNSAGTQDVAIGNADGNTTLTVNGVEYEWPTAIGAASDVLAISSVATPNVLDWVAAGAGDVVGPAGATDTAIARFDTTTGKLLQDSGVLIDASDNMTGVAAFTAAGTANINASANNATNINTGTSTGAVTIGNSAAAAITVDSGAGVSIDAGAASNFTTSAGDLTLTTTAASADINIDTTGSSAAVRINNSGGGVTQIGNASSGTCLITGGGTIEITHQGGQFLKLGNTPNGTFESVQRDPATGNIYKITSSLRYKENILPLTNTEWIYESEAKSFTYIDDKKEIPQVGWIAEEIEEINPELVTYDAEGLAHGIKYSSAIPSITEEMKKLKLYITALESRIAECETKLNEGV